ncbi:ADP-ribose pyrophosphatase, mitochondrial [Trichinella sp. T9]|nr:ADP-ribose pyrophosphatase, mitochondrial [Trichinella sp. T9]
MLSVLVLLILMEIFNQVHNNSGRNQHPVGILKTPQPIMYSDSVKPMCIAEAPLPDEHVCILGVVTKGGLMTLRHVQMLYESDCQELAQGLSSYLCAKVKEIDAEVGETFGLDPSLDIYPFVAPLEFDISGVQSGSLETPLFCLTNEHPTWSVYGFAMNAYDVTDPESPILFSDVSSDLKAIKQHSDVTYQEWVQSINTKHNDLKLSQKMNTIFSIFLISVGAISALAQELETLDISESTPILTPFNETTESLVCDNEQSMTRTVRKILLTEQKVEITEDINPMDALFVMKQLNSYVNKHVKGKTYYKMTRVIKAEKCNAPESDIHLKEGESDEKCKIRTGAEVVDCIWTGRLTRTTVVESQGLICSHYMRRVLLSEMHLQWDDKMLAYAPPEFSAEFNDFPHDNFDPSENKSLAQFNKMDHSVDRRSMIRPYKVKNGRPLCPIGRTGFQGRGKHPRWGPNFVLAVIIDRKEGDFLDILSTTTAEGPFSFPTFYVDDYSKAGIEAKLKEIIITSKPTNGFSEEEIHSLVKMAMKDALLVKMGFVPDARNTDNAWAEAIAVQISDPKQQHIGKIEFESETKSGTVEWRMLDEESQSDLRKYVQRYIEKNKLTEINKSSKKAFLGRVLTFMKKHILAAYFSTWIVLVGAAAFSLCTGIFAPTIALVAVEVGLFILAIILQQKHAFSHIYYNISAENRNLKFSQKMNFTLSVLLISVAAFSALAHELETLDISGSTSISTLLNDTSKSPVCVNPQPIEQTVGKMLLTEQKVEITEDLNSADALVAMKQLNSYVNKHVKGKTYYKITKVIKAEKCNAPESNIHVLEIEIRKTTCKRKDLEEGESDDKCHVRTGAEVVDCLWTGRLIGTTVAESQGLICSYGPYNFFKQNEFLCPLLKYDDTDMRRVDISSRHWKWENKLFAYAPPDFSAEFEDIPYDDFDPSEYKSLAKFNKMDQSVRNGRPLCPIGRTGLQGRGKLPRWGPNFVLAVVVDSGVGHVVDILSTTTAEGPFSIPTFFIDDYSKEGIEAKLEEIIIASKPTNGFSRMEIHSLVKTAMKNALIVKQGFTPDSRNTDNAWTETIAVQISDPMKQHIGKLKFESQAKHNTVEWRTVDEKSQSELRNYVERSIGEARFNEVVNKSDMKSSLKNIITALTGYTLRGLRFIGGRMRWNTYTSNCSNLCYNRLGNFCNTAAEEEAKIKLNKIQINSYGNCLQLKSEKNSNIENVVINATNVLK